MSDGILALIFGLVLFIVSWLYIFWQHWKEAKRRIKEARRELEKK